MHLPTEMGRSYNKLHESLSVIAELLKKSEIENIFKSQYLYAAIQNVGAGLIWFDEEGNVLLINKSTRELLNLKSLHNIIELEKVMNGFTQIIKDIRPSENKLLKVRIEQDYKQISIKATELIQQGKHIKLISLQNIKNELDEAESDSWQKLIRVLAHEIMNSISPIATSTTAVSKYFKNDLGEVIDPEKINKLIIDNTVKGLDIIEERSLGLKDFVNRYRQLSNLPTPKISEINVKSFIEKICLLFNTEFLEKGIMFSYDSAPSDLILQADEKLISNVLINLLKNAIEAIQGIEDPIISLKCFKNNLSELIIKVSDNGSGISPDILDKIFIPFFTTKEEGSGIGLSLSRQIMKKHNGNINVRSSEQGTEFLMIF